MLSKSRMSWADELIRHYEHKERLGGRPDSNRRFLRGLDGHPCSEAGLGVFSECQERAKRKEISDPMKAATIRIM